MKIRFSIPAIFLIILISGFIQKKPPVKKVYAYKQASIPGILPNYSEENDIKEKDGAKKPERKPNYNYWFYIEFPPAEKIKPTGLWINGKMYIFKYEPVTKLPVEKIVFTGLEKNDTTIMAPATKNKIILIYPSAESKVIPHRVIALARENELVISYTSRNKVYYASVKSIKELNPDVRQ